MIDLLIEIDKKIFLYLNNGSSLFDDFFVFITNNRNHLTFCVTISEKDVPAFDADCIPRQPGFAVNHLELAALMEREKIFGKKRGFFSGIWIQSPLPVRFIGPIGCIGKGRNKEVVISSNHASSDMVKMEVG